MKYGIVVIECKPRQKDGSHPIEGHPEDGRCFWWTDEDGKIMVWDTYEEAHAYAKDWHHDEFAIASIGMEGGVFYHIDTFAMVSEKEAKTDYKD